MYEKKGNVEEIILMQIFHIAGIHSESQAETLFQNDQRMTYATSSIDILHHLLTNYYKKWMLNLITKVSRVVQMEYASIFV